ncbi:MAG: T9SS type A sorting domain-containing protein [Candidatus Symbiothrix sp.]|jgi:hypothetical protein|nr:T9SS type A sorting domain-containing protein [Candidatus Symbiothrix sp.]
MNKLFYLGLMSAVCVSAQTALAQSDPNDVSKTVYYELQLTKTADDCNPDITINVGEPTALNAIPLQERVYPNPANDFLNVPLTGVEGQESVVLLLDSQCRLVQENRIRSDTDRCRISLSACPAGVYFVQVIDAHKRVYKVIKK